ncbi:Putative signal peptidase complex subunit Spc1/SPCS1 [Septoria linicola]|uniref:Signal peptidase complex subunit 1 n=1 Tax=Septoria linicola TaxID=215465 RepID=A0A9Q9ALT0_9PEZI|nr:putative signal peptidase complex subunit Spc1/SPCS1 [Septoria linicola]USW51664.1 Putative signal peptidase complex subunit Spc1/SPCS1 [Septoria linicola]
MDAILEQARTIYEGEIDFEGQRLAEYITYGFLSLVGAVAFLIGFSTQNIYNTLYIGLGGTALTFLIVAPPWPYFNQKPLHWLPPRTTTQGAMQGLQGIHIEVDGKKVS